MNKTLEKVAAMSMVAAAMVATSCSTQKKAASDNTNVSDAVVAYPDEAHDMDESYLILDDTQRAQVQKNNAFALKLFTETANMQSTVISPLSVTYLMAMLANGADGETRQQIMSTIGASDADIIEKIDIGGISLIRAGAKNFKDVVIVPSKAEYSVLLDILKKKGAETDIEDRKMFAERAFGVSSHYDTAIHAWFAK